MEPDPSRNLPLQSSPRFTEWNRSFSAIRTCFLPKSGQELWRQDFYKVSTASPVVAGDFVTVRLDKAGAGLYKISTGTKFWPTEPKAQCVINHWSTPVTTNITLRYVQFKNTVMVPQCVELRTGHVKWSEDGYGLVMSSLRQAPTRSF